MTNTDIKNDESLQTEDKDIFDGITCLYRTKRGTELKTYDEARLAQVLEESNIYIEEHKLKAIVREILSVFDIPISMKGTSQAKEQADEYYRQTFPEKSSDGNPF